MKLYLKREHKDEFRATGTLYIDGQMICNTLEPPDRGLINKAVPKDGHNDDWNRATQQVAKAKRLFLTGQVAIPTGFYRVALTKSPKFMKVDIKNACNEKTAGYRPLLLDVPGFEGIRIHEGNSTKNTHGCILVGNLSSSGRSLTNSKKCLASVISLLKQAIAAKEPIVIQIE